jgi:hypothetical protein
MKKETKTLFNHIHIIEDFISPDTCKFLTDLFNQFLQETPHNEFIKGGPSGYGVNPLDFIAEYTDYPLYNVGLDLINNIGVSMAEAVSLTYKEKYVIKTLFYSAMFPGAENKLHMDNHYITEDDKLKTRKYEYDDRAVLLYLNDAYEGGILNFPNQDFSIKPKPGTLIFFEGNYDFPHEVTKVTGGIRNNLISFMYKSVDNDKPKTRPMYETERELTKDLIKNQEIMSTVHPFDPEADSI